MTININQIPSRLVGIDELIPYINNTKSHPDSQIKELMASISEFGFPDPIAINPKTKIIIEGHGRLIAAKKLGLTEVPIIEIDWLSEAQEKAYRIAHNKINQNSGFDKELMKIEIGELAALDIPMEALGINKRELEKLLAEKKDEKQEAPKVQQSATLEELAPTDQEREAIAGRKILMEFSGGKDSSAASIWARHHFPDAEMELCYVDLGADWVGFHNFLHSFAAGLGVPLITLRSKENMIDLFIRTGEWPLFVRPYCKEPLHGALDGYFLAQDPEKIIVMRGGRSEEGKGHSEKAKSRFYAVPRISQITFFQPLYFAGKGVGEKIIQESGLPMWEGYSYGLQRTACRVCPGQRPRAYAAMRANYPEVWAEMLELEKRLGPGFWQDPENGKTNTLTFLADRGQELFEKGNFRRRGWE